MRPDIDIRPYHGEDAAAVFKFMVALQEHERTVDPHRTPGEEMAQAHIDVLNEHISAHEGLMLMAVHKGQAVGFLAGWVDEEFGALVPVSKRRYGYVADFYVSEAVRGLGAGQKLMEAAEGHFRALGLTDIRLFALSGNAVAHRFYELNGFLPFEVLLSKPLK